MFTKLVIIYSVICLPFTYIRHLVTYMLSFASQLISVCSRCCHLQGSGGACSQSSCERSHSASEGIPRCCGGIWPGKMWHISLFCLISFDYFICFSPSSVTMICRLAGRTVAEISGTSGRRCLCQLTSVSRCRISSMQGRQVGGSKVKMHDR